MPLGVDEGGAQSCVFCALTSVVGRLDRFSLMRVD